MDTAINVPGCAKERSVSLEMSSTGSTIDWVFPFFFLIFSIWRVTGGAKGFFSRRDGGAVCPLTSLSLSLSAHVPLTSRRAEPVASSANFPLPPSLELPLRPSSSRISHAACVFASVQISPTSAPLRSGRRNNRATLKVVYNYVGTVISVTNVFINLKWRTSNVSSAKL